MTEHIARYAKHRAYATLQSIVWDTGKLSPIPQEISLLTVTSPFPIHTLIDLSIVYPPSQLYQLFQAQYNLHPSHLTVHSITNDVLPTFTFLLSSSDKHQSLASKRKISESILSFLSACSPFPSLIIPFALSNQFILALASLYHSGLSSLAKAHGGSHALLNLSSSDPDDWPRIWIQTKIALIDSFHILLSALFDDLPSEKERVFDTVFALLDITHQSATTSTTPFLDMPLIADYQHAYKLSDKLSSVLNPNSDTERDPRLDVLESSLAALVSGLKKNDPGLLKIVLSKPQLKTDKISVKSQPIPSNKEEENTTFLEAKSNQILAILPHLSQTYVTSLLRDDRFGGNVERILEGLLDGSLDSESHEPELSSSRKGKERAVEEEEGDAFRYDVAQRKNVFDDEELDVTKLRVGKKQDVGSDLFQDRSTVERMKRDILRRVEEMEEAEAELFAEDKRKSFYDDVDDDDAVAGVGGIRLIPESDTDDDDEEEEEEEVGKQDDSPESIIERAYLLDPGVFERDNTTRRGKARIELRELTGWADEQIEGWKVMLDRTPGKKASLEEKHAFSGNVKGMEVPGSSRGHRGRGRGRGRGRPVRGGGGESSRGSNNKRGGGGGRGGSSSRKRGHDRKVARAGGIA